MNTGYKNYAQLAYRRSILAAVQRFLRDHVSDEIPATQQLICEEVLASDREVPDEAFLEVIEELQREEQEVRLQMSQYEFIRRSNVRGKQEEAASERAEGQPTAAQSNAGAVDS